MLKKVRWRLRLLDIIDSLIIFIVPCRKYPGEELHAVVTFPAYPSLYDNPVTNGCEVSTWKPEFGQDGWCFDINGFKQALKRNTRLVVINFPHNPTGFLIQFPTASLVADRTTLLA